MARSGEITVGIKIEKDYHQAVKNGVLLGLKQYRARLEDQGKHHEAKELNEWIDQVADAQQR